MKSLIERLKIEADYEDENGDLGDVLRDAIAAIEAAERALKPFGKIAAEEVYPFDQPRSKLAVRIEYIRQASEALKLIRSSPSSAQADPQADQAASRGEL